MRASCSRPMYSPAVLPGLPADAGLHGLLPEPHRAHPAADAVPSRRRRSRWCTFWDRRRRPARGRVVPPDASARRSRRPRQRACSACSWRGCWCATSFRARRLVDALVDLPFALPTAVAGIALTALYAPNGWLGAPLAPLGIKVAFTPLGITVALIFIGLPFVVRTVQPVLEDSTRGRGSGDEPRRRPRAGPSPRASCRICIPPWLTGFALAFARALGEYGSVVFIAGNMPMRDRDHAAAHRDKLEQYDYAGATAIAFVLLSSRSCCCSLINALQGWSARRLAS